MCYRKSLLAFSLAIAFIVFVIPNQADGFGLGDLNPFAQDRLLRLKGRIRPPSVSGTLKKMNSGTQKILSGTKDVLFPWAGPKRTTLPTPPPPTGTRRVYPASARPNS